MPSMTVTLHMLGISDEPEWCASCALPSLLRVHFAVGADERLPSSLRSFTVCTECGRQRR